VAVKNLHHLHELTLHVDTVTLLCQACVFMGFLIPYSLRNFDSTMLSLHAAKLLSSRLWKKASYTNRPRFIINGSTAHTARIVLTFLHDAFKDRVISYRITQGQICRPFFSVVNASNYSRRTWLKNKVFANWSQAF
jgi:hypothetical protein